VSQNRLAIAGQIIQIEPLRHTPAGIPFASCVLFHGSQQDEAGRKREVQCEIQAVAFGEAALELAKWQAGKHVQLAGFLARKSVTNSTLVLHVTRINPFEN
jgi:primosomal replication protein N